MTKFKVGDIVDVDKRYKSYYFDNVKKSVVIQIVHGNKEIFGNWCTGKSCETISNGYLLTTDANILWMLSYEKENEFNLIGHLCDMTEPDILFFSCPRCRTEMKEYKVMGFLHGSEYIGHKCPGCGYCR